MAPDGAKKPPFVILPGDPPVVVMLDANHASSEELVAAGHCMEPVLSPGDRLKVELFSGSLKTGSIAVFRSNDRLFAHRVTKVGDGVFWAAGDKASEADGPIPFSRLIGTVSMVCRDGLWSQVEPAWSGAFHSITARVERVIRKTPLLSRVLKKARAGLAGLMPGYMKNILDVRTTSDARQVAAAMISWSGAMDSQHLASVEKALAGNKACLINVYFAKKCIGSLVLMKSTSASNGDPIAVASSLWLRWVFLAVPVVEALLSQAVSRSRDWGVCCIRVEIDRDAVGFSMMDRADDWRRMPGQRGSLVFQKNL